MPYCPSRLGMELNVSQLLMEPSGSGRRYDIDEPVRLLDGAAMSRIHGSVKLLRTNKSVWVSAALDSSLDSECGRCLTPYSQPIHLQVEEEYVPTHDPASGWKVEPPPGDADYYLIDENHILNLAEAVREYAVMALPIKPLCDHGCAGLCPNCGADLNRAQCPCETPRDARWGPLLELIQD